MNEFTLDLLGHVGHGFIALGMFLVYKKSAWGWASRFTGESIWMILGLMMGMTSIWSWGMGFMILDVVAFRKWREDKAVEQ